MASSQRVLTPRPLPADALALARRRFLDGARIDMSALAEELGVNRVTLYRWFGSRDRFMVEVAWSRARDALDAIEASVRKRGAARIVEIVLRFLDAIITDTGMQRWLAEEGEHAMRLLTRHETGFQPRLIAAIEALLREEADAGRLELPVDLHELAYVVVRLIESYVPRPDHGRETGCLARGADPPDAAAGRLISRPAAGPPARSRPRP